MTYASASKEQIKQFNESGFIVIKKAINPNDLNYLETICDKIIDDPEENNARDWPGMKDLWMNVNFSSFKGPALVISGQKLCPHPGEYGQQSLPVL